MCRLLILNMSFVWQQNIERHTFVNHNEVDKCVFHLNPMVSVLAENYSKHERLIKVFFCLNQYYVKEVLDIWFVF